MDSDEEKKWRRRIERERSARKQAEALLEEKSRELYQANVKLEEQSRLEIERREKQYQSLFDYTLDGIAIHDLDGNVIDTNREFSRMIGQGREALRGIQFRDLHAPDYQLLAGRSLDTLQASGADRFETVMVRADGSSFPAEVSSSLTGHVIQTFIRDLTARNRTFDELKAAKDEAERSNLAKSQFLANMSHEIRTPMNGIIGVAELLRETGLTKDQGDLAETILTSGETLLAIINDILDFSKIESGSLELEASPFSLAECVETALAGVTAQASQKNLEMACLIDPDLPENYIGDIVRLRQVITNLVGNAVKFTDEGEVDLRVPSAGPERGGKQPLRISVRDTGIGIEPADLSKIFEKFSQVDSSTTRRYGGTGLGLTITKRIVEIMGGTIEAESIPGQGTTFSIDLELPVGPPLPVTETIDFTGRRVVIVDDNRTNLFIMTTQCEHLGMEVEAYLDPGTALAELLEHPAGFDIGLIDMQMPEIDGLDFARRLRSSGHYTDIPLVLVSSLGQTVQKGTEKDWPFDGFLAKPILLAPLRKALQHAFREKANPAVTHHLPPFRALRILVADDNSINLRVTSRILEKMGHQCEAARNGIEVLELLETGDGFDAIFMDVQMPEMDGLETTSEIVKRYPTPDSRPRIIALTAEVARESGGEEFLAAGMDDCLGKPVRRDTLEEALGKVRSG